MIFVWSTRENTRDNSRLSNPMDESILLQFCFGIYHSFKWLVSTSFFNSEKHTSESKRTVIESEK